jgi:hypothetical protein
MPTGKAAALVPCKPTGSNALIPAGTAAALVPIGAATGFVFVWTAIPFVPGWVAGALVSAGATIVSVCATAGKAARMKTKRTLKLFMVLQYCGFRQKLIKLKTLWRDRR